MNLSTPLRQKASDMKTRTKSDHRLIVKLAKLAASEMKARHAAGVHCTFESIAARAGCSPRTVSRFITRKESLNLITAVRVFEALDWTMSDALLAVGA